MELKLIRKIFTDNSTIGDLYIDGVYQCRILEDVDRELYDTMPVDIINSKKVYAETAIPYGTYEVIISRSKRFSALAGHDVFLPELLNVKGFAGVRIHSGNKPTDSEGCLLTGVTYGVDVVNESRKAFSELFQKIQHAKDKITLTIEKEITSA